MAERNVQSAPAQASVSLCTESSAVTHVSCKWEDHKHSCKAGLSEHFVTTNKDCISFVLSSKKAKLGKHVRRKLSQCPENSIEGRFPKFHILLIASLVKTNIF